MNLRKRLIAFALIAMLSSLEVAKTAPLPQSAQAAMMVSQQMDAAMSGAANLESTKATNKYQVAQSGTNLLAMVAGTQQQQQQEEFGQAAGNAGIDLGRAHLAMAVNGAASAAATGTDLDVMAKVAMAQEAKAAQEQAAPPDLMTGQPAPMMMDPNMMAQPPMAPAQPQMAPNNMMAQQPAPMMMGQQQNMAPM